MTAATIRAPSDIVELQPLVAHRAAADPAARAQPTAEELGGETGLAPHTVAGIARSRLSPVSLASPSGMGDRELADVIPDRDSLPPERAGEQACTRRVVAGAMRGLSDHERAVLRCATSTTRRP